METDTSVPALPAATTAATGSPVSAAPRRRVMLASAASVLGVAGLAACAGGDDSSASADSPSGSGAGGNPTAGGLATPASDNVEVIAVSEVPEGGAVKASAAGLDLLVTRPAGGGDPKVFSSICPHQNCKVAPNGSTNLKCPCHFSTFEIATGAHIAGPAPTGLSSYPSKVIGGKVVLTSTTAQAPA